MENKIELNGLDSLRLLSAFQALRMPSKCYGVTHKQARDIIEQLTGKRPKGKPETSGNLEHYLSWHFGCVAGRAPECPRGMCTVLFLTFGGDE